MRPGGGTSNGVAKCRLFSQAGEGGGGGGGSVKRGELGTKRKSSRRAVRGIIPSVAFEIIYI